MKSKQRPCFHCGRVVDEWLILFAETGEQKLGLAEHYMPGTARVCPASGRWQNETPEDIAMTARVSHPPRTRRKKAR